MKRKQSKQRKLKVIIEQLKHEMYQSGRLDGYSAGLTDGQNQATRKIEDSRQKTREDATTKMLEAIARIVDAAAHLVGDVAPVQR